MTQMITTNEGGEALFVLLVKVYGITWVKNSNTMLMNDLGNGWWLMGEHELNKSFGWGVW